MTRRREVSLYLGPRVRDQVLGSDPLHPATIPRWLLARWEFCWAAVWALTSPVRECE